MTVSPVNKAKKLPAGKAGRLEDEELDYLAREITKPGFKPGFIMMSPPRFEPTGLTGAVRQLMEKILRLQSVAIYICLTVLYLPVASGDSNGKAEPADKPATATRQPAENTDVKHEDILDRIFSPLDQGVSDINRDINAEDKGAEPDTKKDTSAQ